MTRYIAVAALLCACVHGTAQTTEQKETVDSLYIHQVEEKQEPHKILHAEPLFVDLIRDLGARKGEKEWNVGIGITDNNRYDSYRTLIEYEFAPVDRLGLEIEIPFTFYSKVNGSDRSQTPGNRMESIKTAAQFTFLVAPRINTSMAIGYINELTFADFNKMHHRLFQANVSNPFVVLAKRWGNNFHTLLYTGPRLEKHLHAAGWKTSYDLNTNFHYMIPGTRNFLGIELNKEFVKNDFDMVIRPQLRVSVTENLLVGILAGVPVQRENQRFSAFARIIWEPGARH